MAESTSLSSLLLESPPDTETSGGVALLPMDVTSVLVGVVSVFVTVLAGVVSVVVGVVSVLVGVVSVLVGVISVLVGVISVLVGAASYLVGVAFVEVVFSSREVSDTLDCDLVCTSVKNSLTPFTMIANLGMDVLSGDRRMSG